MRRRRLRGGPLVLAGLLLGVLGTGSAAGIRAIRVDQLGYRPGDPKLALAAEARGPFSVRPIDGGPAAFEGTAGPLAPPDPASGDRVATLDFTGLRAPGEYVVTAADGLSSPPFRIGETVYTDALKTVLQSFKYQRCGTAITDGSPFARPACHLVDAQEVGQPGTRRDVTGGWHDAGDYGKYVPAAGITLWHLGMIQALGQSLKDADLPPPRNGVPALLDEMRWELDWLLKMQRDDGAVHHKVAPARWTGDRAPQDDHEPRYLHAVSSAATADMAAATAQAARLFESTDPAYARRLLGAAEAAWRWLEQHPAIVPPGGFKNPPGHEDGGGAYDDEDDRDERFWAATELWRTTGNPRYRTAVLDGLRRWTPFAYPASWQQVQNLAFLTLLDPAGPLDPTSRAGLVNVLQAQVADRARTVGRSGYRVALEPGHYYWGSNGLVVERAVELLTAFRTAGRPELRDAGLDQLHYILGRNGLGKSFVTGLGTDPPSRPYHQPSLTHPRRLVLPGLLVGGPNAKGAGVTGRWPARAYRDEDRLYGVNEPAIYWTAALAHALALVQAAP